MGPTWIAGGVANDIPLSLLLFMLMLILRATESLERNESGYYLPRLYRFQARDRSVEEALWERHLTDSASSSDESRAGKQSAFKIAPVRVAGERIRRYKDGRRWYPDNIYYKRHRSVTSDRHRYRAPSFRDDHASKRAKGFRTFINLHDQGGATQQG